MTAPLRQVIRRELEERPFQWDAAGVTVYIRDVLECGHPQSKHCNEYRPTRSRRCEPCRNGESP